MKRINCWYLKSYLDDIDFYLSNFSYPDFKTVARLMHLVEYEVSKLRKRVRNKKFYCKKHPPLIGVRNPKPDLTFMRKKGII